MYIAIDIGNTQTKIGLFRPEDSVPFEILNGSLQEVLNTLIATHSLHSEDRVIICSVSDKDKTDIVFSTFQKLVTTQPLLLTHQLQVPVKNDYHTPETLGMDRLAAAIGGITLFPDNDCLVIDAGTCITYDFIKEHRYKGGAIAPGLKIKFKALHNFTANLPLVDLEPSTPLIGTDTKTSILSGVLNGTIAEINHTISEYKGISDNLAVILCGGNAEQLHPALKNVDCVEQRLVLIGLNEILKKNVELEQHNQTTN